jgi:predicted small secreted protein
MRARLLCLLVLATSVCATACATERRELGVDIFSDDTLPTRFTVTLSGTLVMGLRSQSFYMRKDKSLVLVTPGSLVIQEGEGTAMIESLDESRRIAVDPIGTSPDSTDVLAVVGRSIKVERVGSEKRVKLAVERP